MTQQEKMFAMIEERESSGQTKAAFARASGISIQTFHYWFRRYQQRQPTKSPLLRDNHDELIRAIGLTPISREELRKRSLLYVRLPKLA